MIRYKTDQDNIVTFEEANSKALDKEGLAQKNGMNKYRVIENIEVPKKELLIFQF